jgi:hypothetical protein
LSNSVFFAGLNVEETAHVLAVSAKTVKRDWSMARAWLYRELRGRDPAMTPERWSRLGDLFEAALQRQRQDRSAFLEQACAGDDELRTEVASLIEAYESARGFLIRPAMPGASLILRETLEQGDGSPKFAPLLGITVGNRLSD